MFGIRGDYQIVIDCAEKLQAHIESMCADRGSSNDIPEVSVSLGQYAAVIEVDELTVWHSECDSGDLSPELVIESFTKQCGRWLVFSSGASA